MSMINQYEMFMKLALRAQNQSRMTWVSLAAIKNPTQVAIVRQANFCVFRPMPGQYSGASRAGIPAHAGPPFRRLPAGVSEAG